MHGGEPGDEVGLTQGRRYLFLGGAARARKKAWLRGGIALFGVGCAQAHGSTTSCPIVGGSLRRIGGSSVQHLQEANEKIGAAMAASAAPLAPALLCFLHSLC